MLSLVSHALLRGVTREHLKDDLWWWLDLFRNEFVLPEREALAARVGELLDCMRSVGLLDDGADGAHPMLRASAAVLQNFREAYWTKRRKSRRFPYKGR